MGPDTWRTLCEGQSIGHKRIQQFDPVEVAKVRLVARKSADIPLIRKLAIYRVG